MKARIPSLVGAAARPCAGFERHLQRYAPTSPFHTTRSSSSTTACPSSSHGSPRLRFAPSPTGHLHLGGLRTALFNHLFARRFGGKWLLRIEDTDRTRLVPGAVEALQETLAWCGLEPDEGPLAGGSRGPYMQSERLPIYQDYAQRLIDSGKAYRDFRPRNVEEEAAGGSATRGKLDLEYDPPDEDEARRLIRDGKTYVVRLKTQPVEVAYEDAVFGHLSFPPDLGVTDPILLKSDGWPTYHLAHVVDDHEMGITHVFRGEEWLPSVSRHLAIWAALNLDPPQYYHLPLLMNADGTKLSKRSGDVHVEAYRQAGWEPQALVNFVALMGYNHHQRSDGEHTVNEDRELMAISELIEKFEPSRISHTRATVDQTKLSYLNRGYLAAQPPDRLRQRLRPALLQRYPNAHDRISDESWMARAIPLVLERTDRISKVPEEAAYLFMDDELPDWTQSEQSKKLRASFDKSSAQSGGEDPYVRVLEAIIERFEGAGIDWNDPAALRHELDEAVQSLASASPLSTSASQPPGGDSGVSKSSKKKKPRGPPHLKILRHALTAQPAGPAVGEIMSVLGREATLARLRRSVAVNA